MTIQEIITQINTFSNFYEYSDSPRAYSEWNSKESNIKINLLNISAEEIREVKDGLNSSGKAVWERYFKNF